jgi:hypothetical protein
VVIAVAEFIVVGCGHGQGSHKSAAPTTSTRPAAVFDGTCRLDYDGAKVTVNGAPRPQSNFTFWWAFRSSCGSTGCVATGTRLDDNNHQVAFTPATTDVFHFVDGHWQQVPLRGQVPAQRCLGANGTVVAGEDTQMVTSSRTPGPDGTLLGVEDATFVTSQCGFQGTVFQTPTVATRVGNVSAGVTVADTSTVTASPATSSPTPAAAGPALSGIYRLDFDYAHQTRNDGVPITKPVPDETHWWAFRSLCTSSGCVATGPS